MPDPTPSVLAGLPGYDTSPDIYETPEPATATQEGITTGSSADRTSSDSRVFDTTSSTTSGSEDSGDEDDEDDDEEDSDQSELAHGGVNRRRLRPRRARGRFEAGAGRVSAGRVDLSDRVDGRRRGYKIRSADNSRGVKKEGLDAKIARLKREIEECRVLVEKSRDGGEGDEEDDSDGEAYDRPIETLGRMLASLESTKARPVTRAQSGVPGTFPTTTEDPTLESSKDSRAALGRIADLDTRLAALEQALGLSAIESLTTEGSPEATNATPPLLPSLTFLDEQMSALLSASSLAGLDAMGTRIRRIRKEADELAQASVMTGADGGADGDGEEGENEDAPLSAITREDRQTLMSLYALLPTLQSLAPTVPALLTRLRSLRMVHSSAGQAAADLDELERQQASMEEELRAWRQGLDRVEAAVKEAGEANGRNGKVVETWVRELEARVKQVGR